VKNTLHPLHPQHRVQPSHEDAVRTVGAVRGVRRFSCPLNGEAGSASGELGSLFAAAYLRLLASRVNDSSRQNPLDSPEQESDELAMTITRRRRRA
jgi:hypothetical protein